MRHHQKYPSMMPPLPLTNYPRPQRRRTPKPCEIPNCDHQPPWPPMPDFRLTAQPCNQFARSHTNLNAPCGQRTQSSVKKSAASRPLAPWQHPAIQAMARAPDFEFSVAHPAPPPIRSQTPLLPAPVRRCARVHMAHDHSQLLGRSAPSYIRNTQTRSQQPAQPSRSTTSGTPPTSVSP